MKTRQIRAAGNVARKLFAVALAFFLVFAFATCDNGGGGGGKNGGGLGSGHDSGTGGDSGDDSRSAGEITEDIIKSTGVEIKMAWIPAGTFMMGSPISEPNRGTDETQYQVTLSSGFYMSIYQLTQEQYVAVMETNPSVIYNFATAEEQIKFPVQRTNWYHAIVFCNELSIKNGLRPAYSISNSTDPSTWGPVPTDISTTHPAWDAVIIVPGSNGYRLPTEAQWEYACRAGTITAYNTGDTISDNTGWYVLNGGRACDVGLKPPNAWGLYDMHGLVSEWCWDWYGDYPGERTDYSGPSSGVVRTFRGGSWNTNQDRLRSATRNVGSGSSINGNPARVDASGTIGGFRLVRPAN